MKPSPIKAQGPGSMKIYFCYEKNACGKWGPVCYHGEPPRPEQNGKDDPPSRTQIIEVDDEFIFNDGTPNFKRITDSYPGPKS